MKTVKSKVIELTVFDLLVNDRNQTMHEINGFLMTKEVKILNTSKMFV